MKNIFKSLFKLSDSKNNSPKQHIKKRASQVTASRIGEIGEYKIDIQLDQMPKKYKYLSDILIKNKLSKSGYSQIDHVVFTPYAVLVIETKNYTGIIF